MSKMEIAEFFIGSFECTLGTVQGRLSSVLNQRILGGFTQNGSQQIICTRCYIACLGAEASWQFVCVYLLERRSDGIT